MLFGHLVRKPDAEMDLERAALLVAEAEYPGLDVGAYVGELDTLGRRASEFVQSSSGAVERDPEITALSGVLDFLYKTLGFSGNTNDYYDPRNSFLNDVLDRRTGIPITLAIVLLGVCRRVGIEAKGVSFPGHFLVRVTGDDGDYLFVDPFEGRILDSEHLRALYEHASGGGGHLDPRALEPAGRRQIVARLLNNLRAIYEQRGDGSRLQAVVDRLAVVSPLEPGVLTVPTPAAARAFRLSIN